jgi:hypothetical protein
MQFGHLGTELYYDFLNLGFKLTASAGSDVPWGGTIGEVRMYAYVGDRPFEPDAWFDAVREGHTFVTNGPMLEFKIGQAIPGDEIVAEENETVHVRARAWGHAARMVPTSLEVVLHGDVIRRAAATGSNKPELSLEFDLPTEHGYWIAARAEASDGSQAHTTPIYVVREPFRFWKYSAVEGLLRRRFDDLSEVEGVVATAQQLNRQGRIDYHRPWKQMALQAPELLDRIRAARDYYGTLQDAALRERGLRTGP